MINKFIKGDALVVIPKLKEKFDLILTDPPYNIGWQYSDKVNDRRSDYFEWCMDWINKCINVLKGGGGNGIY